MRRLIIGSATALALGLGISRVAGAQGGDFGTEQPRMIRVGFAGGVSVPISDAKDALKNGFTGEGFVLVRLGPLPAVRLNLNYQRFDFKQAVLAAGQAQDGHSEIFGGTGGISLNLLNGPVRPYLTAGVGAFNVKNVIESTSGSSSASKTKFGIDGGGGIALHVGRLDAFIEGRIQNVYTERGLIDTKSIQSIPVTFGIVF
jgi:opacity protein-like surface antigen